MIYLAGREFVALRDKGGLRNIRERSLPTIKTLNRLWRESGPLRLRVVARADRATVEAGDGTKVLELLPGDAPGQAPREAAREKARVLAAAYTAGGRPCVLEPEKRP